MTEATGNNFTMDSLADARCALLQLPKPVTYIVEHPKLGLIKFYCRKPKDFPFSENCCLVSPATRAWLESSLPDLTPKPLGSISEWFFGLLLYDLNEDERLKAARTLAMASSF